MTSLAKGGISIGSIKSFNHVLLRKWQWRLFTSRDALWGRLIKAIHGEEAGFVNTRCKTNSVWNYIVELTKSRHITEASPQGLIYMKIGNGKLPRFWIDNWLRNYTFAQKYNGLFRLDYDPDCLVSDHLQNNTWDWRWTISLSVSAKFE
ncbi:uncharacterized protein [Rutidosis leptorrhynchoides]|uniref:uncharacterized protein n=1 Tax=Rutidosis leptorrhynchoides TaxID=125765 RepID=UPI003A999852